MVKTREGRPIKIEGHTNHPLTRGTSIRTQSTILNLYDPERLRGPLKNLFNEKRTNKDSITANWDEMDKDIAAQLQKGQAVLLTGALNGPSTRAVVGEFCQAFKAKHVVFEPLSNEEVREGQKACYGDDSLPSHRFDKAKIIVSIDADFIGTWLSPTAYSKQFADGRRDIETMSRLVVFDSNFSLTGANADNRIRIKPSQQLDVVLGLLHELVVKKGHSSYAGNSAVKAVIDSGSGAAGRLGMEPALLSQIADDLWENRGKSLVVAGGLPTMTAQGRELQIAVNFLNQILENDGKTVEGKNGNPGARGSWSDLAALVKDMKEGKVKTLIMHNVNPNYVLGKDLDFAEASRKVEMLISTADRLDESAAWAHYVIPDSHPLETWGDAEPVTGMYILQQPTIRPMYDTRSFQTSLMTWAFIAKQGPTRIQKYETFYDYLQAVWKEDLAPKIAKGRAFDDVWMEVLQKGFIGEAAHASPRSFKTEAFTAIKPAAASTGLELVLYPTLMMGDGSGTNVSWLHEVPDPVTKIVWDNYASVSLAFAKKNNLQQGDVIEVTSGDKKN